MFPSDYYITQSELDYRKDRNRKAIAAHRGGRSRSSWLRRIAAADKTTERSI